MLTFTEYWAWNIKMRMPYNSVTSDPLLPEKNNSACIIKYTAIFFLCSSHCQPHNFK